MRIALLGLLLTACTNEEPNLFPVDPQGCFADVAESLNTDVLMHGSGGDPLPTTRIEDPAAFRDFLELHDLPDLDADFPDQHVLVTTGRTVLDCEYIEDFDRSPELVRRDDGSLGLILPLARSSDDCFGQERALPIVLTIPAGEPGEIEGVCLRR